MYVVFYDPDNKQSRDMEEKIKGMASNQYDLFKTSVVNCRDDEEICEEFEVYKAPKILLFSPNLGDDPLTYKGAIEEKAMAQAAYKLI